MPLVRGRRKKRSFAVAIAAACALLVCLAAAPAGAQGKQASVASINSEDLTEYAKQPQKVRELIDYALGLTRRNLGYRYGCNSPQGGGMDCSGTIQHALGEVGVRVPRSSYTQYQWALERNALSRVKDVFRADDPALNGLQPGDLLFWTGTHSTSKRHPPVSHVMIFLGTLKSDGKPVIFGASSGRRFRGKKIHGVSVFDFKVPTRDSKARFVAFGPVPGLR